MENYEKMVNEPDVPSQAIGDPSGNMSKQDLPPPPPYTMNQQPYVPTTVQMGAAPGSTIIVNNGEPLRLILHQQMGPDPMQGICPSCGQCVVTHIEYELGSHAYTMMGIFCLLGGLLCCWIPACVPSMQDVIHHCPNCKAVLGRHNR